MSKIVEQSFSKDYNSFKYQNQIKNLSNERQKLQQYPSGEEIQKLFLEREIIYEETYGDSSVCTHININGDLSQSQIQDQADISLEEEKQATQINNRNNQYQADEKQSRCYDLPLQIKSQNNQSNSQHFLNNSQNRLRSASSNNFVSLQEARIERKTRKNRQLFDQSTTSNSLTTNQLFQPLTNPQSCRRQDQSQQQLQDFRSLRDQKKIRKQNNSLSNTRDTTPTPLAQKLNDQSFQNQNQDQDYLRRYRELRARDIPMTVQPSLKISIANENVSNNNYTSNYNETSPIQKINLPLESDIVSIRNSFLTDNNLAKTLQKGFDQTQINSKKVILIDSANNMLLKTQSEQKFQIIEENAQQKIKTKLNQDQNTFPQESRQKNNLKNVSQQIIKDYSEIKMIKIKEICLGSQQKTQNNKESSKISETFRQNQHFKLDLSNKKMLNITQQLIKRSNSCNKLEFLRNKFGSKHLKEKIAQNNNFAFKTLDQKEIDQRIQNKKNQFYLKQENNSKQFQQLIYQSTSNKKVEGKKSRNIAETRLPIKVNKIPAQVTIQINQAIEEVFNTLDGAATLRSQSSNARQLLGLQNSNQKKNRQKFHLNNSLRKTGKSVLNEQVFQAKAQNQALRFKSFDLFNQSPNCLQYKFRLNSTSKQKQNNKHLIQNRSVSNFANISLNEVQLKIQKQYNFVFPQAQTKDKIKKQIQSKTVRGQAQKQQDLKFHSINEMASEINSESKNSHFCEIKTIKNFDMPRQLNSSISQSEFQSLKQNFFPTSPTQTPLEKTKTSKVLTSQLSQQQSKIFNQTLTNFTSTSIFNTLQSNQYKQKHQLINDSSTKNALQRIIKQVNDKSNELQIIHQANSISSNRNQIQVIQQKEIIDKKQNEEQQQQSEVKHIKLIKQSSQIVPKTKINKDLNTSSTMNMLKQLQILMPTQRLNGLQNWGNKTKTKLDKVKRQKENSNIKGQDGESLVANQIGSQSQRKRWTHQMNEKVVKPSYDIQEANQKNQKSNLDQQSHLSISNPILLQTQYYQQSIIPSNLISHNSKHSQVLCATPDSSSYFYDNPSSSLLMRRGVGESRIGVNVSNDFSVKLTDESIASICIVKQMSKNQSIPKTQQDQKIINHSKPFTTLKSDLQNSLSIKKKSKARNNVMGEIENILFEIHPKTSR